MGLLIEDLHAESAQIGLTKDEIRIVVESRLRVARLYADSTAGTYVYVNAHIGERAFMIRIELRKSVYDPASGFTAGATVWQFHTLGTHGRQAGLLLSTVGLLTDRFVLQYLRVNAEACEGG